MPDVAGWDATVDAYAAFAASMLSLAAVEPGMAAHGGAAVTGALEQVGLTAIRTGRATLPWSANRHRVLDHADRIFARMPPRRTSSADQRAKVHAAMREIADRDPDAPFESIALIGVGRKPERRPRIRTPRAG